MNGLSLLAKGKGLLDGGVEIECLPQTRYTLSGQSFTRPSLSRKGQYATMVKPYALNLPKTFVTRRGALVLFTSPDDMIIGKSCQVHEQTRTQAVHTVSKQAADSLKTTNNLAVSALSYDTEKDSGISEGEGESCGGPPLRPGNYTNVYLKSLEKLKVKTKSFHSDESQSRGDEEMSELLLPIDSDSGFDSCSHPTASGRLSSAFSYQSDLPTPPVITVTSDNQLDESTDNRQTQVHFDDNVGILDNKASDISASEMKDDTKELLSSLLSSKQTNTQVKGTGKNTKKKVPANKKKLTPKNDQRKTANVIAPPSVVTNNSSNSVRRLGRKKTRKQRKNKDALDIVSNASSESQILLVTKLETQEEEEDTILSGAIQEQEISDVSSSDLPKDSKTTLAEKRLGLQSARAEQRRLEIERKRQEKRDLELQKKQELAKQAELRQQLSSLQEVDDKENVEEQSVMSFINEGTVDTSTHQEHIDDVKVKEETTRINEPVVKKKEPPGESALLKRAREMKEKALQEEMRRREAEQEQLRRKKLEEERMKKVRKDLERIEQTIKEQNMAEKRLSQKEELNYQKKLEEEAHKIQQQKAVNYFSYFNYLPSRQKQDKKKTQRTAMPKRIKS